MQKSFSETPSTQARQLEVNPRQQGAIGCPIGGPIGCPIGGPIGGCWIGWATVVTKTSQPGTSTFTMQKSFSETPSAQARQFELNAIQQAVGRCCSAGRHTASVGYRVQKSLGLMPAPHAMHSNVRASQQGCCCGCCGCATGGAAVSVPHTGWPEFSRQYSSGDILAEHDMQSSVMAMQQARGCSCSTNSTHSGS